MFELLKSPEPVIISLLITVTFWLIINLDVILDLEWKWTSGLYKIAGLCSIITWVLFVCCVICNMFF